MSKNVFYVNGCSYACGAELHPLNKFPRLEHIMDKNPLYLEKEKMARHEYRLQKSFPGLMYKDLGYQRMQNKGVGGSSNERIVRTAISDLLALLKTEKSENIFALINMTGGDRREFFSVDHNSYVQLHPASADFPILQLEVDRDNTAHSPADKQLWEIYYSHFYSDLERFDRTCLQMILLKSFMETKGIPYMIAFSLTPFGPINLCSMETDTKKELITPRIFSETNARDYLLTDKKNFLVSHPSEQGHRAWADRLLRHIQDNNLL
jgi:hypothetical protein